MTLLKYEHKKADFYVGDSVIADCISTCPACAARDQLAKAVAELELLWNTPYAGITHDISRFGVDVLEWIKLAKKEIADGS